VDTERDLLFPVGVSALSLFVWHLSFPVCSNSGTEGSFQSRTECVGILVCEV